MIIQVQVYILNSNNKIYLFQVHHHTYLEHINNQLILYMGWKYTMKIQHQVVNNKVDLVQVFYFKMKVPKQMVQ